MGLKDLLDNEDRPLTDEQADATDEVFYRFAPGNDYRDQVVSEFLKLEPIPLHAQTRQQKLPGKLIEHGEQFEMSLMHQTERSPTLSNE